MTYMRFYRRTLSLESLIYRQTLSLAENGKIELVVLIFSVPIQIFNSSIGFPVFWFLKFSIKNILIKKTLFNFCKSLAFQLVLKVIKCSIVFDSVCLYSYTYG